MNDERRIALVTGAGRGIGRAIALSLASAGARVAVTACSRDQLDSLVEQIKRDGGPALASTICRTVPPRRE